MIESRRSFLVSAAAATVMTAIPHKAAAQKHAEESMQRRLAADPTRPQFHLLPARNWMNDPNGPIYFKGRYHMFFQYNPLAPVWGDMSWGHAVSSDMLHWTHLPVALTPTPDGPDSYGCFSGSAISVGDRVYVVYTGTKKSTATLATIRDGLNDIEESQCLAWSDDPWLIRWQKDSQPVIPRPPDGMQIAGFRDPSAWRQGDWFYMTVGSGVENLGGCVLLYRSSASAPAGTLKEWEFLHKLTSGEWDGKKTANPCDDGEMWECPDFFKLGDPAHGGGHVLIYSTLGKVYWQSGVLDEAKMLFTPKKQGELDWGGFYAPKTQRDATGRRILWGWIQENNRTDAQMRAAGWSGMMSLPRLLTLDSDGTLRIQELPEISSLRNDRIQSSRVGERTSVMLPRANGEIICIGETGKNFTLSIGDGLTNLLQVSYSAERHAFTAGEKEITLQPRDLPKLHAFVDASVIELNLGERIGYTRRFYASTVTSPDISVTADGAGALKLDAWSITPISKNRLTTPAHV